MTFLAVSWLKDHLAPFFSPLSPKEYWKCAKLFNYFCCTLYFCPFPFFAHILGPIGETRHQVAVVLYHPPYNCHLEESQEPILKIWWQYDFIWPGANNLHLLVISVTGRIRSELLSLGSFRTEVLYLAKFVFNHFVVYLVTFVLKLYVWQYYNFKFRCNR